MSERTKQKKTLKQNTNHLKLYSQRRKRKKKKKKE